MKEKKFQYILYLITAVIVVVLAIQAYWNLQNYKNFKRQILNDVQISLDNAVASYYNNLAKNSTFGLTFKDNDARKIFSENGSFDSLINGIDASKTKTLFIDSISKANIDGIKIFKDVESDTFFNNIKHDVLSAKKGLQSSSNAHILLGDTLKEREFKILTSKIVISITNDSLSLTELDTLLTNELKRKELKVNYVLNFKNAKGTEIHFPDKEFSREAMKTQSNSNFLPKDSELKLFFTNQNTVIFRKMLTGLLISTLLVISVIGSLFYLLYIIKHQKQLAEIKNDLISNITHEFKTPIATISAAIEGIKNFNSENDPEKTDRYLDMSNQQLGKLNVMVEKLLETATLDSDKLTLELEPVNLNILLESLIRQHQLGQVEKQFSAQIPSEQIVINADPFHIENAIGNIIDNAVKYGGNKIEIHLSKNERNTVIEISDSGTSLTPQQMNAIFEKFYRVGEGNVHNVKGFGIGLYYTKKIIEKHHGTIDATKGNGKTIFRINLPHG
ncbi:sensor histidine kinase [Aegicerativicinus sediminis]|uniref:sensor histidine kinase n=1 Tax=Aegicerativicinus sediminis TaxID=2893202 RepID=UPI001E4DB614|nr:HAMP domain-containing sensor histidine kinase [Aegicerativicinus sediminis]